ncbi:FAD-dependent thymidylate synthase [bacterium]|nr:FAD-dependent thymidylate synthase [bacterium]
MQIIEPSVELLAITPNAEELIERAGRTCYKSEDRATPDSAARFIRMLLSRGHLSVLEHATATLKFVCDRGVSHELVRHRTAAFSQESTRYCNYGQDKFGREIRLIRPPLISDEQKQIWQAAVEAAEKAYLDLLDKGAPPELARSVLPHSLATEIVMTANFRNWLHFLDLRCAPAAHPQIRALAEMARDLLKQQVPNVFGALG